MPGWSEMSNTEKLDHLGELAARDAAGRARDILRYYFFSEVWVLPESKPIGKAFLSDLRVKVLEALNPKTLSVMISSFGGMRSHWLSM